MKKNRPYIQSARADATERTRVRVLRATIELADTTRIRDITLAAIAAAAGTSVPTVLRSFGGRQAVLDAAASLAVAEVERERLVAPGDAPRAIDVLMAHYEHRGDPVLLLLAQEGDDPRAAAITTRGRALHRDWVRAAFAPHADDDATCDLLVVATDVYAWKLLRRDRGLSRELTARRLLSLVEALLKE